MSSTLAYYNEIEPYAAQWLRNLIAAGHLPEGDVDERSIIDVQPDDLAGYTQCHFFAGLGGWPHALRLAGWPDGRPVWTGSCPCQPFSSAGKARGLGDDRHLWPAFFRLIAARRPAVVLGEQVAAAVGQDWLDGVSSDLESVGYACGAAIVPACSVDAPHKRDRLWFVADAIGADQRGHAGEPRGPTGAGGGEAWTADGHSSGSARGTCGSRHSDRRALANTNGEGRPERDAGTVPRPAGRDPREASDEGYGDAPRDPCAGRVNYTAWTEARWVLGADGKARRVEPGVRLLADGVPARMAKLRALGNAIVPQVAAEVIGAYMDVSLVSPASPEALPSTKGLAAASLTIADPVKEGGR